MLRLIKLTYHQIIDSVSEGDFEKAIFNTSYNEFIKRFSIYNKPERFITFEELSKNDGRAHSLHLKLSFAVNNIIDSLNNIIPHLQDQVGNHIEFKFAKLNLLSSNIEDESIHKVELLYTTDVLTLHEIVDNNYHFSKGDNRNIQNNGFKPIFIIKTQPGLSVTYGKKRIVSILE